MTETTLLSLSVYGIAIVISFAVAGLIRGIVVALPLVERASRRQQAKAPPALAPAPIPPDHVAAIAAAVAAVVSERHIVHIEDRGRGAVWTAEGRMIHQTSHEIPRGRGR